MQKTLDGIKVLVTRDEDGPEKLSTLLEAAGAEVCHYPTVKISEPRSWKEFDLLAEGIAGADCLLFTSSHAVHAFADRIEFLNIEFCPADVAAIVAVGPKTASSVKARLGADAIIPECDYSIYGLLDVFESLEDTTLVIHPRGCMIGSETDNILSDCFDEVMAPIVYRVTAPDHNVDVVSYIKDEHVDVVTFCSPSAVENFVDCFEADPHDAIFCLPSVSIGKSTSEALKKTGLARTVEARAQTFEGVVEAIESSELLKRVIQRSPRVRDERLVPEGPYCYTRRPDGSIKACPYHFGCPEAPEQAWGYCSYLGVGDWMDEGTFLLWDSCKECGINDYEEEEC